MKSTIGTYRQNKTLVNDNDYGKSFLQIADIIEKNMAKL